MSAKLPGDAVIPVELVRKDLAKIDARLEDLKRQTSQLRDEESQLLFKRSILAELAGKAIPAFASAPLAAAENHPSPDSSLEKTGLPQKDSKPDIPDGSVASHVIYDMLRERPGMTSIEVMDALSPRITKRNKSPRKFLGDLIYELRHRNKIRRESDGGLFLV